MATERISILIADDHAILRSALAQAIGGLNTIDVVGQAGDGRDAVQLATELRPTVVLMDLLMPTLDGIEATRRVRQECPETRVLVLTGAAASDRVLEVLRAGANGMLPKTSSLSELERAMQAVARGEVYVAPELAAPLLAGLANRPPEEDPTDPTAALSSREREVFQLIGEGYRTRDIAESLVISPKTVAQHKANIIKKLGLAGARELQLVAARWAIRSQGQLAAD